jgi:hypothetical protein
MKHSHFLLKVFLLSQKPILAGKKIKADLHVQQKQSNFAARCDIKFYFLERATTVNIVKHIFALVL